MASKSAQQEPEKAEVIEEALDILDKALDRVKVLYEQYFLGIQKQAPTYLHTDVERKMRDIAQMQIRNTALRYRLTTLQQKYGAYSTYWRRTLKQIENGTYVRNLSKIGRKAARTGEALPEEILAAMPKRMREQVVRDRDLVLALARRQGGEFEEEVGTTPFISDDVIAMISESTDLRRNLRPQSTTHLLDPDDVDIDLNEFFAEVERQTPSPDPAVPEPVNITFKSGGTPALFGGEAGRTPTPTPIADQPSSGTRRPAGDARTALETAATVWGDAASGRPAPIRVDPVGSAGTRAPSGDTSGNPTLPGAAAVPRAVASEPSGRTAAVPSTRGGDPRSAASDPSVRGVGPSTGGANVPPAAGVPPRAASTDPSMRGGANVPAGVSRGAGGSAIDPATRGGVAGATADPTKRPLPATIPPIPKLPSIPPVAMAPSQVTKPNPIAPGSAAAHGPKPVESMAGPFPRVRPAVPEPKPVESMAGPVPRVRPAVPEPVGRAKTEPGITPVRPPAPTRPPQTIAPAKPAALPGEPTNPEDAGWAWPDAESTSPRVAQRPEPVRREPERRPEPPRRPEPEAPRRPEPAPHRPDPRPPEPQRPATERPTRKPRPAADAPRMSPPPGMTDADVNALFANYVKAKEMVGESAGPGSYGKLLKTINAQAPKIMQQYNAKGVDFSIVVKDNQVIIRAKPKT